MKLTFYTRPTAFLDRAQSFLEQDEASNSLILGIALRLHEHPEWTDQQPYLATIEDDAGALLLAAAITPPHNLLAAGIQNVPPAAIELLIAHLREGSWRFAGFNAKNPLSDQLAQAWQQATGQQSEQKMRMRLYTLRQIIPPPHPPPGALRLAGTADLDLVLRWRAAFIIESLHEQPPKSLRRLVESLIQGKNFFLWEDQSPVSMAANTRATPHGISINSVYTPPEHRGKGYASACVAALSQRLLDEGRDYCALFTDLDYPTSNSIYQKIGYQPVCDFAEYHLL